MSKLRKKALLKENKELKKELEKRTNDVNEFFNNTFKDIFNLEIKLQKSQEQFKKTLEENKNLKITLSKVIAKNKLLLIHIDEENLIEDFAINWSDVSFLGE